MGRYLTGVWSCNDGGTYYIKQIGDIIWWYGESAHPVVWSNVARGTISGRTITLEWADVPKGKSGGSGTLVLYKVPGPAMYVIGAPDNVSEEVKALAIQSETGGFGGSWWNKTEVN
jgi:hypothetical protein